MHRTTGEASPVSDSTVHTTIVHTTTEAYMSYRHIVMGETRNNMTRAQASVLLLGQAPGKLRRRAFGREFGIQTGEECNIARRHFTGSSKLHAQTKHRRHLNADKTLELASS